MKNQEQTIILVILVLAGIYCLFYNRGMSELYQGYENYDSYGGDGGGGDDGYAEQKELYQNSPYQQYNEASCFPQTQLDPNDLLPKDNCSQWANTSPYGDQSLMNKNFLQAGATTGITSVGSTLRNANLQLRSEPPNPQVKVSPWLQTTIEPDISRKPFEIGYS